MSGWLSGTVICFRWPTLHKTFYDPCDDDDDVDDDAYSDEDNEQSEANKAKSMNHDSVRFVLLNPRQDDVMPEPQKWFCNYLLI